MKVALRGSLGRFLLLWAAAAAVCSAQFPSFPASESAAKAVQVSGQVSLERDRGTWAINIGTAVGVNQIIVTGADGFAVFEVADGSTFEVYPSSRVTFRANPGNLRDLLDVWLGRVKVHIQKLGGQPNPHRIKTPTAVISVRGTTFDIVVEDEISTLVSVIEGQVAVTHAVLPSSKPKILNDGEYLRVYRDEPIARVNPNRDKIMQRVLNAATEAFYRAIYSPGPTGGGRAPGGGGGNPLPGDTDGQNPPPPPAPESPSAPPPPPA